MGPRFPGCVKTPTLNLRVEFPSRFRRCGKPIALATSVRRRQLRKQFCASLAQASFHTAWVKSGKAQCEQMFSALPLRADIAQHERDVRKVPILLKKSFLADEQNFSGPLMRSARGDVRDHIVLHKNDHGPSYRA